MTDAVRTGFEVCCLQHAQLLIITNSMLHLEPTPTHMYHTFLLSRLQLCCVYTIMTKCRAFRTYRAPGYWTVKAQSAMLFQMGTLEETKHQSWTWVLGCSPERVKEAGVEGPMPGGSNPSRGMPLQGLLWR